MKVSNIKAFAKFCENQQKDIYIAPDKRGYPHNIFLFSPWKQMLWVLIRSVSVRQLIKIYFSPGKKKKDVFDFSCKFSSVETICMTCQILFSGKNRKCITNLSSVELAQKVVRVSYVKWEQKTAFRRNEVYSRIRLCFQNISWKVENNLKKQEKENL